jgi:hypothetical protein
MPALRIPVMGLLLLVAIAALALLGLREQTPLWSGTLWSLAIALLVAAAISAALARGPRRAFALGFALAGWTVLAWTCLARDDVPFAPVTEHLARLVTEQLFAPAAADAPATARPPSDPFALNDPRREVYLAHNPGSAGGSRTPVLWFDRRFALQTIRALVVLAAAGLGGLWAVREHRRPRDTPPGPP